MEFVRTEYFSIIINGQPIVPFEAKKGLRQENPLSSSLFALG